MPNTDTFLYGRLITPIMTASHNNMIMLMVGDINGD